MPVSGIINKIFEEGVLTYDPLEPPAGDSWADAEPPGTDPLQPCEGYRVGMTFILNAPPAAGFGCCW